MNIETPGVTSLPPPVPPSSMVLPPAAAAPPPSPSQHPSNQSFMNMNPSQQNESIAAAAATASINPDMQQHHQLHHPHPHQQQNLNEIIEHNKNSSYHHIHHLASSSMYPPAPPSLMNNDIPSNTTTNQHLSLNNSATDNSNMNPLLMKRKLDENLMIDNSKKQKFTQEYSDNPTSLHQNLEYNSYNLQQHHPLQQQQPPSSSSSLPLQPQPHYHHSYPLSMPPTIPSMHDNMGGLINNSNPYIEKQQDHQQQSLSTVPAMSNGSHLPLNSNINNETSDNSSKIFSAENLLKPDIKSTDSSFNLEEPKTNPSMIPGGAGFTAPPTATTVPMTSTNDKFDEALKIHEKLREMGEISVKPVNKSSESSSSAAAGKRKEGESSSGFSIEIKKKINNDKMETEESKRITNLRKNIREVMDENQLDATTLAAQRQESERLARVQEQQKLIRDVQRQMAVERQNNRTQSRVLSLLQGQNSLLKNNRNDRSITLPSSTADMYVVKGIAQEVTFNKNSGFIDLDKISSGNLTPSVSIAPVRRNRVATPGTEESTSDSESKKEVVTIDSSSEDDCIVLSDDDEEVEEEPEDDPHNSGLHVNDAFNTPDDKGQVVVNIGHPEGEPDIFVAPQIARVIKPHQIGGVRFLFDNIIESTERFSTSTGFGCILAHSMGLGKTLQVACFCDIFLRHTNSKSVLCIMPINTLQNWIAEFNMWLPEEPDKCPLKSHGEVRPRNFRIFVLNDQHKSLTARAKVILEWAREGGVLLIGYELFRLLSLKLSNKKKKRGKPQPEKEEKIETPAHRELMENIYSALVRPGPDLVICDEGHRIKNSHASISVALKQIRSKRRIVLTGYPLQNNLLEYWCMVDFVRPNYLGTKTEFSNMFERPIQNGQCIDSTPQDIKLMRYRAHVLHSLLVGFVQRRSHAVLQNTLPQKEEYVILVRMTPFQRKLYNVFMNEVVRTKAVPNPLKAFAVCCKIWNHPDVLYNFLKKREADLDLELEEVDADGTKKGLNPCVPGGVGVGPSGIDPSALMNAAGRRRRATKKSKEIIKNGKNIPAIEVPPQNMPIDSLQQQQQMQHHQQQIQHPHQQMQQPHQQMQQSHQMLHHQQQIQQQPQQMQQQQQQQQMMIKEEKPDSLNKQMSSLSFENNPMLHHQQQQQHQNRYQQQSEMNGVNNFQSQVGTAGNNASMPAPLPMQPYGIPYASYNSYAGINHEGGGGGYYGQYENFYTPDQYSNPDYGSTGMNYNSHPQGAFWEGNPSSFFGGYNPAGVGESSMNPYNNSETAFGSGNSSTSKSFNTDAIMSSQSDKSQAAANSNSNINSNNNNSNTNNSANNNNNNNNGGGGGNSGNNFENNSSSELVDLDTKEIKTVETNINSMEMLDDLDEKKDDIKNKDDIKKEIIEKKEGGDDEDDDDDDMENKDIKKLDQSIKDEESPITTEKDIKPATKEDGIPYEWAVELMKGYIPDLLENSPKMVIFFRLLEESLRLGDRILVFSQSLLTLNLIERFLQMTRLPGLDYNWVKNKTYFRLDGSTTAMEREKLINEFNANPDIHLFLVSTRAGSLGINLVGANRVIVFDASWNPCHDTQAVCRVYRYGQKKPCFVYRLVMDNCLEKKIYDRQVNKQGMSDRVVDECNPDAHLSIKEVTNLCYDTEEDSEWKDIGDCKDKYLDIVMQKVIEMHRNLLSKEPFQHESLLIDRKEKKLSQAEKRLAQRGYEMEKRAATKPSYVYHSVNTQYRVMRTADGSIVHRPVASVRPMQAEMNDKHHISRPGGVRPTRWIPAEVWQRQGMTAQEMTLPLDVVIPTSSGDKSNIVLKAGQKVMVLKSPKGIYMQLESGKIIAIRTSFKVNQNNRGGTGGVGNGDKSGDDCEITTPSVEDQMKKAGAKLDNGQEVSQTTTTTTTTKSTTTTTATVVATTSVVTSQQPSTESTVTVMSGAKKDQNLKSGYNFAAAKPIYAGGNPVNVNADVTTKPKPTEINPQQTASYKPQPNIYSPARQFAGGATSTGSKNFNVQHLIDKKPTVTQPAQLSNTNHQQYPKIAPSNTTTGTDDVVMVDSDNEFYSSKSPILSQQQHNVTKYPTTYTPRGSKYNLGNMNARPQYHTSPQGNINPNMANVKPHNFHEPKPKWDRGRPADGKNAFQTITIDDDFEAPLREKVVYKPNLIERKSKPPMTATTATTKGGPQRSPHNQIQPKQHHQQLLQQQHLQQSQQLQHQQPQQHQQHQHQQQQSLLKQDRSAAVMPAVVSGNGANGNGPMSVPNATSTANRQFYAETNQSSMNNNGTPLKHSMSQHLQSSKMLPPQQSQSLLAQKNQHLDQRQKQIQPMPQSQSQSQISHHNSQGQIPHQNVQPQVAHQNSQQMTQQKNKESSNSNNMRSSPKMPSIRNIPAPYPSIYAAHGQNAQNIPAQQQLPQSQAQNSQQQFTAQQQQQQSTAAIPAPPPPSNSVSYTQNKLQEKIPNSANSSASHNSQQNMASTKSTSGTTDSNNITSAALNESQVSSVPVSQPQSQPQPQTQSRPQSQPETQYSHYSSSSSSSLTPSSSSLTSSSSSVPPTQLPYSVPPIPAPTPTAAHHLESNFYSHHDSPYQHHYPNLYAAAAASATPSPYNYPSHGHSAYSPYASYHHNPYDLNSYSTPTAPTVPPSYSTPLPPHPPPPVVPTTPDVGQYHHQYSMYPPPPTTSTVVHHQPPSISEPYNSYYPYSYPPAATQWRPQ